MKPTTIDEILELLQEQPNDAELYQHLGKLYHCEGRRYDAKQAFERSIALDPDNLFSHLFLANWFLQNGQCKEALKHFKLAAILAPDQAIVHWCLGDLYREEGRFKLADAAYKKAVKVDPSDDQAKRLLEQWYDFYYKQSEPKEPLKRFRDPAKRL